MATRKLNKAQLVHLLKKMSHTNYLCMEAYANDGDVERENRSWGEWMGIDTAILVFTDNQFANEMWDLYCGKEQTA